MFNKQLPDCDSTGQFVETCERESTPQGVSWKYENKRLQSSCRVSAGSKKVLKVDKLSKEVVFYSVPECNHCVGV